MTELQVLRQRFDELRTVYEGCVRYAHHKMRVRIFVHAWLADVGLTMEQLERQVVQLEAAKEPPTALLRSAWAKYDRLFAALEPTRMRSDVSNAGAQDAIHSAVAREEAVTLGPVANRLRLVYLFLALQLVIAAGLLAYSVQLFTTFDPQTALTRQQFAARAPARANLARLRLMLESMGSRPDASAAKASAPSTPPSHDEDVRKAVLRSEVEGILAAISELPLATADLRLVNAWLDHVLTSLDADTVDYSRLLVTVRDVEQALGSVNGEAPPAVILLIVLGSLLGMITITSHLNWKFRNQWDTAGFIPWYITKLVAAPTLSLAAAGFLSQVRFEGDQAVATGASGLGLLGASPLLIFSIAIVTGLFSNRMFEWLKDTMTRATTIRTERPAPEQPKGGGGNASTNTDVDFVGA